MSDPAQEQQGLADTAPPGGPQRQDASDAGLSAGDVGADREASDSVEDHHEGTIPVQDEQSRPEPSTEETATQRENAETSEDQPSDGAS